MKIAVDVCIGKVGVRHLRDVGHEVVAVAEHGEMDRSWFERAVTAGAELIVSPDSDLEILAYDYNLKFFRPKRGCSGLQVVHALMSHIRKKRWRCKKRRRK